MDGSLCRQSSENSVSREHALVSEGSRPLAHNWCDFTRLRALATLPGDLRLVPSTHGRLLTIVLISSFKIAPGLCRNPHATYI